MQVQFWQLIRRKTFGTEQRLTPFAFVLWAFLLFRMTLSAKYLAKGPDSILGQLQPPISTEEVYGAL